MNPLKQAEYFISQMEPGTWYSFLDLHFTKELIELADSNNDGQHGFQYNDFEDEIMKLGISTDSLILNNYKNNQMKNHETPIKDILFRSSKIGLIAGGLLRNELTDIQRAQMEELEAAKIRPIGLSEKQQAALDSHDKKIEDGETLTPNKMAERDDFRNRLTTLKGLTPKQEETLQMLIAKDKMEPELSQGAKTHIKDVWLLFEKGVKEEITSKHTRKGLQAEEDALNLISFVDNIMYIKNDKRVRKGHLVGECDVNTVIQTEAGKVRMIDDTKCSWNPHTFMMSDLSTIYEWQGRAYLYLYDADVFRLRYCLVDCPPDVLRDELKKFCWANNIMDETLPEYKDMIDQFHANFLYEKSGRYNQKERVKTFMFERDLKLEKVMLKAIKLAVEYYQTITLNMV